MMQFDSSLIFIIKELGHPFPAFLRRGCPVPWNSIRGLAGQCIPHLRMTAFRGKKFALGLLISVVFPLPFEVAVRIPSAMASESLQHTAIYVDPQRGDDAQTGESQELSLKTITQALKIAPSGSIIELASGTYSEETGEVFPLIIKTNITIKGSPGSRGHNIIVRGNGYFISPTGAGQNVTLAAIKEAGGITGVTVINPHTRGHGVWIESANPRIVGNTFTRNGNTGLSVNGKSSPLVEDNNFYGNGGNGLLVYGTSKPTVKNNIFEKTGFGVSIVQTAAATLINNSFTDNRIGVILEGNARGTLRNNTIENSTEYGLTAIAQSHVDLGTSQEPGNNVFRNNAKLDIQNATNNEIVAVGTEINGPTAGNINFNSGDISLVANNGADNIPEKLPPLPPRITSSAPQKPIAPLPEPVAATSDSTLPAPPPLSASNSEEQELVFNAPPSSQPVPFPPNSSSNSVKTNISALNSNEAQISSLSDVLGSSRAGVRYKVLVEISDNRDIEEVRSLYPDAFSTVYRGKSALQVGAFSNWDKAKEAVNSLEDLGFDSYILE